MKYMYGWHQMQKVHLNEALQRHLSILNSYAPINVFLPADGGNDGITLEVRSFFKNCGLIPYAGVTNVRQNCPGCAFKFTHNFF